MIVDIEGDSKEYNDAYKYLVTSFPCDLHLHSAFCLTAFEKTLRMLRYDAYRVIDEKISVTQDVNRIAYYKDEVIEGVAIRASFDEFYDLLDYEEYIIIVSESIDVFMSLYKEISKESKKFEIITFRKNEREYLKKMQKDFYVHYWEVYEIEPMKYKEEFDAVSSLFSYEDIKDCKFIQDDEKNPIRYKHFYDNNVDGYFVFSYCDDEEKPALVTSVLPYVDRVAEIKISVINENEVDSDKVVKFLRNVIANCSSLYDKAILRVKNPSYFISSILNCGKFKCISKEEHIHM